MNDNWTPGTEQVRAHYVFDQTNRWDPERGKAFDRWLAAHDAKVQTEALKEAARWWSTEPGDDDEHTVHDWLMARAVEVRPLAEGDTE